jgi:hypothetical protein
MSLWLWALILVLAAVGFATIKQIETFETLWTSYHTEFHETICYNGGYCVEPSDLQ